MLSHLLDIARKNKEEEDLSNLMKMILIYRTVQLSEMREMHAVDALNILFQMLRPETGMSIQNIVT